VTALKNTNFDCIFVYFSRFNEDGIFKYRRE